MNRKSDLAKIHIAKKDLGIDDITYRSILYAIAKVNSAKDLTDAQASQVIAHFKRCGWKPTVKAGKKPSVGQGKQALINKIEAQLAEAKRPWMYADAMAKRMFQVERVRFLTPEQLHKLVAALEYDARRHKG